MRNTTKQGSTAIPVLAISLATVPIANADVVTDWNMRATAVCAAAKLPPPPAYRIMAIAQTATLEAISGTTRRYPGERLEPASEPGTSPDAAVAAANRAVLSTLIPSQQAAIDKDYEDALSVIPEGAAKTAGIRLGEQAAAAVLAERGSDGAGAPEAYRPRTSPGVYVPTVVPAAPQWPARKPWVLARADQFRPGPPPPLASRQWARDYNEIKSLGAKHSTSRSTQQTDAARFWEASGPAIYFGLVRSIAEIPGRDVIANARLYAASGQAMDDALISVFDAKHHYGFWRPLTAIRNGDRDGNAATKRDGTWLPLIDTPMHPEYPCAHCSLAAAVGEVLRAETGPGPIPLLRTTSATAPGMERSWNAIDDFVKEVAEARIHDGVHYRTSTEVGGELGRKVGRLVARRFAPASANATQGSGLVANR